MKKLITFLTLSITSIYSFGQITITNADMPSANDTFRLSTTINAQGLDPVLTGANFSWDFSTLVPDSQRVDTFFSVSSTPFLYQVSFNNPFSPNYLANYAKRGVEISFPPTATLSEVFNYTKNFSGGLNNVGFGANINGLPASVKNDPIDKEYVFPLNYTNGATSLTSLSEFEITVPALGHYGQDMERNTTVDGWGSLVLPNGTYDVLRVKSVLTKIDTAYLDLLSLGQTIPRPEEIEYKWLAAGTGAPILKIITNAGIVSQIEYQDDYVAPVSVKEQAKLNNVVVFPNPTKYHLVIDYSSRIAGNLKVILKDVLGKSSGVVYQNYSPKGTNKIIVNLAQHSIKPGIYFLELTVDGNAYYTEKVVVVE
jgi:hypothetical protein